MPGTGQNLAHKVLVYRADASWDLKISISHHNTSDRLELDRQTEKMTLVKTFPS